MRRSALTDILRTSRARLPGLRLPSLSRGQVLAYSGAALGLAGIGAGTAAAEAGGSPAAPAGIAAEAHSLGIGTAAGFRYDTPVGGTHAPASPAPGIRHLAAHAATPAPGAPAPTPGAHASRVRTHVVRHGAMSWRQARDARPRAKPAALPTADLVQDGPAQGQQSVMPISGAQLANATTIVAQALHKHMGLRSAVVAVATAMQESTLQNISYGDRDSLGLFQQRPSMGWGSAQQITTPSYAADAFLTALHAYQKDNPDWASQPLWATAQAVQKSGFPQAYAKWESQAAQLVSAIAQHLR